MKLREGIDAQKKVLRDGLFYRIWTFFDPTFHKHFRWHRNVAQPIFISKHCPPNQITHLVGKCYGITRREYELHRRLLHVAYNLSQESRVLKHTSTC